MKMSLTASSDIGRLWNKYSLYMILLVPIAILLAINPIFRQGDNLLNLWQQASIIGLLAIGQTIVIIQGGFDLSVGAVAAFTGVLCYLIMGSTDNVIIMVLGLIVSVFLAAVIGLLNGVIVAKLRITPFIATLGMLSLVRGAVLIISDGHLVYAEGMGYKVAEFFQSNFFGMPISGLVFFASAILVTFILRKTVYGHFVYAIGGNERAASLAGIPVTKVKIISYALCSALAGLGGILLASRTASALPNAAINYELQAITAAVIGGAALAGGKGSIAGTVVGVILLTAIGNALNLYNVSPFWQTGVTGAILLLAVGFSNFNSAFKK